MMTLHWSSRFLKSFKKKTKQRPDVQEKIVFAMRLLEHDPLHPQLKTHKLHGVFDGLWACSIEYDLRIVFEIIKNQTSRREEILLIDIGHTKRFIRKRYLSNEIRSPKEVIYEN